MRRYIENKVKSDLENVKQAISLLGEALGLWHKNGFAHGDAHLNNAIIVMHKTVPIKVSLVDYCLIHHRDFYGCKQFDCFGTNSQRRMLEDLENESDVLGNGFRNEIKSIQKMNGLGTLLEEIFDRHYFASLGEI